MLKAEPMIQKKKKKENRLDTGTYSKKHKQTIRSRGKEWEKKKAKIKKIDGNLNMN